MFLKIKAPYLWLVLLPALVFSAAIDVPTTSDVGIDVRTSFLTPNVLQVSYQIKQDVAQIWLEEGEIPSLTRWLAVPPGETIQTRVLNIVREEPILSTDQDQLSTHWRSSSPVEIGTAVPMEGVDFIPLVFHPLLNSETSPVLVSSLELEVQLPVAEASLTRLSHSVRMMWGDLLLNNGPPQRDDGGEGTGYVYVVPADERVPETLEALINWRKLQGFEVRVLTVQDEFDGDFVYEQLQNLNQWGVPIEYICLVGDTGGEFAVPTTLHGTSDYHYSLLSGDDPFPDAAVGRISYNSIGELERITRKILDYERDPDFEDLSWLSRGAVCAGSARSGFSTILVNRWVRDQLYRFGFSAVDTFWYTMGGGVEGFLRRSFDQGVAFVNYRGFTGMEDFSTHEAGQLVNRYLPVSLLIGCNTGDYDGIGAGYTEALLRAEGGAIGAIGSSTNQSRINYNNALLAGFYRGVLDDHVCRLGWSLNRAKMELFATYGATGREWVINHAYWTNLMGDPATVIWLGEPRRVQINAPGAVAITPEPFEVSVIFEGQPVPGVRVGLYKEFNFTMAGITDERGIATFSLNPNIAFPGAAILTVSGDRVYPISQNIQLNLAPQLLTYRNHFIIDNQNQPINGNGDGIVQPFEVFQLNVSAGNAGNQAILGPINCEIRTDHDGLDIQNNFFRIEQDLWPGGMITPQFLVQATEMFPDREPIPMTLRASTFDQEWTFEIMLEGESSRWSFIETDPPDFQINPGANHVFNILIENNGSRAVGEAECFLESISEWVEVSVPDGNYAPLEVGNQAFADFDFEIMADPQTPLGVELEFVLHLFSEQGIEGDVFFTLRTGGQQANQLTGPDNYGYYAIDNQDNRSNLAPRFEWLEINPNLNGPGRDTGLLDQREDDDQSVVVSLPFDFQYYGQQYNRLTICSNGWAAFGDQPSYVDFRNLPIGSPQGPGAQLCPWWDDLYQPGLEGGIFYYYEEARHRFIVEWSQMHRWVGPAGPGAEETFQLVLNDPYWYPTLTGDGDILFLYSDVTHEARIDGYSTPYATIGIGDPEDQGGLQYGFWNRWAPGARAPAANTAIRFATAQQFIYAFVNGTVQRAGDQQFLVGAVVRSTTGGWVVTNENGMFENLRVLANSPFQLEATLEGYNANQSDVLQLAENGWAMVDLSLTQPVLEFEIAEVVDTLDAGREGQQILQLGNAGDGPLDFSFSFTAPQEDQEFLAEPDSRWRDDPDELWERLVSWNVTEAVDDNRILGVAFTNDDFWVSGGLNGEPQNRLYRFNRNGDLMVRIFQPCEGLWGMHDLAWDGENLYGGCRDRIYVLSEEGQLVNSFESPLIPPRGLAVDPESRELWIANDGDPIHHVDAEGNTLGLYPHHLRPYGLAWHPEDEDDCPLYVFSADGETNLLVSKMNPETGEFLAVTELMLEDGDRAGGCELSLNYDTRRWSLITVVQSPGGDRVDIFDAGPNYNWLSIEPQAGSVAPDDVQEVVLNISSLNLDRGVYNVDLLLSHNAEGGLVRIPVRLFVEPQVAVVPGSPPEEFVLNSIYPNPANSSGVIKFVLPRAGRINLSLWDNLGRKVTDLTDQHYEAGQHSYTFLAQEIPSGIYYVRLQTQQGVQTRKFALLK